MFILSSLLNTTSIRDSVAIVTYAFVDIFHSDQWGAYAYMVYYIKFMMTINNVF